MLRFFRSAKATAPADLPPPTVGDDRRVYAIGDIHGRLDLLRLLIDRIAADDWTRGHVQRLDLILLGDYVDRGPQSSEVLDFVIRLGRWWPNLHCLMGNHEEVMQMALRGDDAALRFFMRIGGQETARSYGLDIDKLSEMSFSELRGWFDEAIPDDHVRFLSELKDTVVIGDYLFVHAGIRPEVPLEDQDAREMRWIREDFLTSDLRHEHFVIHGHSITEEIEEKDNRIGIDTGAYASGRLTAIGLQGTERWFLSTADE
jgi:serine/threonine protein phosphatase 1